MFENIKDYGEYRRRISVLWLPDYEERELEEFPCSVIGGFHKPRLMALFRLIRLHPEYHIASCFGAHVQINAFVCGAVSYYLAEGDPNPNLIHDPSGQIDVHFIQSRNSGLKSFRP